MTALLEVAVDCQEVNCGESTVGFGMQMRLQWCYEYSSPQRLTRACAGASNDQ